MGRVIGIDLGTTNSVAAYWHKRRAKPIYNAKGSPFMPSVVMIKQGYRTVGQDAKDQMLRGTGDVVYSIKRFIGRDYDDENVQKTLKSLKIGYETRKASNGEVEVLLDGRYYNSVEISAMILEQLKKDAEVVLGEEVTHAVITVPAYFGQRQKNATREAGQLAGLKVLRIINEPTAAALAFGVEEESDEPQQILVYDLGGGTFDVSILVISGGSFDVLHVDGDNLLGGDDFDQHIVAEMLARIQHEGGEDLSGDEVAGNILAGLAEQAKIELSRENETRVFRPAAFQTRDGRPINVDYTITRGHFEDLVEDLVQRSIDITCRALRDAGFEVDDIDRVLLVGGMTRVPMIRRRMKEIFGDKIEIDVDPMQCVGLGAAVQTMIPIEWLCPHCQAVNDGTEEICHSCGEPRESEDEEQQPHILCDECGKPNRQGRRDCWNCGTTIGAIFAGDEVVSIRDITAMYIGVETEDGSGFATVIPKGTLYPTDEPFKRELYTSHSGQKYFRLPVYELETEDIPREKWQHIGVAINDKLPPGSPGNTPIMVEMRIDGDGMLVVQSYVKKDKIETREVKNFKFVGDREKRPSEALMGLDAFTFALERIVQVPFLSKHLNPGQAEQASQLVTEARSVLEVQDEVRAPVLLKRIDELIGQMPVPTWDLFLVLYAVNQPQTSAVDRSQTEQTIMQMEQAASRGDYDTANQHLEQLRRKTEKMFEKLPSGLLKQMRGS
jgi:molecular chaperone DnaK (HSP70)